jgi:catechol 2,3-dioxygenase-like lactoylglutathione lyase family enzyme
MIQTTTHITRLGTVLVPVTDQDRSVDFYTGTLGFEKRIDADYGGGNRWVEVAPAGAATTLALVPSTEQTPAGSGSELSLATRNAAADHADLLARGVDADAALIRMGGGVPPMFTFRDPDGNRLRMVERD